MPPEDNESVRSTLEAAFEASTPVDNAANEGSAPKAAKETPQVEAPAAAKPASPDVSEGDKPAKPADAPKKTRSLEAPVRWTKEEKEQWESMIDDGMDEKTAERMISAQKILLNRNKSVEAWLTKEMTSVQGDRAWKNEVEQAIAPFRSTWQKAGISDAKALNELLQGFEYSNRDPIGFIKWIAQQRGVDIAKAFPSTAAPTAPSNPDEQVQLHPAVQAHLDRQNAEIQTLRQQLGGVGTAMTQRQQQEDAHLAGQVEQELGAFESATDEHGQAKHPFFAQVRHDMGRLIMSGMASGYDDAYDKAVYARPELRAKLMESNELRVRREVEARLEADAKKARSAGGGLRTTGSGMAPAAAPSDGSGSVRDILNAAIVAQMNAGRV